VSLFVKAKSPEVGDTTLTLLLSAIVEEAATKVRLGLNRDDKPKLTPRYLTYETAGQVMDMPSETVRSLVKQGRLPASKDGRIVRIFIEDIDAYMNDHRA
jgi:excisionase family DNA binding protein